MKNEQKKNYVQPKMTVLDYGYQANVLLCDSCKSLDDSIEEIVNSEKGEAVEFN